jgi:fibronectin-binding autotransporter adhesin
VDAGTYYWDVDSNPVGNNAVTGAGLGGDGTWNTSSSPFWWNGTSANGPWPNTAADTAVFGGPFRGTVLVGASGVTVGSLLFTTSGYDLSGGQLTLGGATPNISVGTGMSASIDSPVVGSVGLYGGGTLTLGGSVVGGSVVVQDGTLILAGSNSYAGTTTVAAGATLQIGDGGTSGTLGTAAAVLISGSLVYNRSDAVSVATNLAGSGSFTAAMSGLGSVTLSGANTYAGGTTVRAGTLVLGSANALPASTALTIGSIGGYGTLDLAGRSITVASLATAGTAALQTITNNSVTTATLTHSGAGFSLFGGSISNGSSTMRVAVAVTGGTLKLARSNSFTGGVTVSSGATALLGADNAFGAGALVLGSTGTIGTLDLNGFSQSLSSFSAGAGAVAANQVIGNGSITADATLVYTGTGGALPFSLLDGINGGTRKTGLTLAGSGVFSLSTAQSFTGDTRINSGTLQLTSSATLASANIVVAGTLSSTRTTPFTVPGNISGAGTVSLAGATTTTLSGANTYAGATTLSNGATLKAGAANSISPNSAVVLGNQTAFVAALDLNGFNASIPGLTVNSNTASPTVITIAPTKTLTVTGNVTVGTSTRTTDSTTVLQGTGGGAMAVTNLASGAFFNVGGTTNTTFIGNLVTADFSGLASLNISLNTTNGVVSVFPNTTFGGQANTSRYSTLILAPTSTITADKLGVGTGASTFDGTLYNGSTGQINTVKLGSGANKLYVNTLAIGGDRDLGALRFNGASGTVEIANAAGTGPTALNIGTGPSGNGVAAGQPTGFDNTFDVTGHQATLNFGAVNIGTQNRLNEFENLFAFDQGTLTMSSLTASKRTADPFAVNTPRTTKTTLNFGGGTTVINGPVILSSASGAYSTSAPAPIVDTTINISGNANVTVGVNGGTAINMASYTATGGTGSGYATSTINLLGGTLTVGGDILNSTFDYSSTINLDGGTLDMGYHALGTVSGWQVVLNLHSGVAKNVGYLGTRYVGLSKSGPGTVLLSGPFNYGSVVEILGGVLQIDSGLTAGSPAQTIGIGGAGMLEALADITLPNAISLTGFTSKVSVLAGKTLILSGSISGSSALSKEGSGTLMLTGANTYSSAFDSTVVNGGTLQVGNNGTIGALGPGQLLNNGTVVFARTDTLPAGPSWIKGNGTLNQMSGTLTLDGPVTGQSVNIASGARLNFGGGDIFTASHPNQSLTGLNIASSGRVVYALGSSRVLQISSPALSIALAIETAGVFDVTGNSLILDYALDPVAGNQAAQAAAQLGLVRGFLSAGFAEGAWNGAGGLSSSRATDFANNNTGSQYLTGLGYIDGALQTGSGTTGTFLGRPIDSSSVLVRYTYYGDTNLDGAVNTTDYTRIDAGFSMALAATWANGDFNYDGRIDFSDYALMDTASAFTRGVAVTTTAEYTAHANAFGGDYTTQVAALAAGMPAMVPEPASMGLLLLGGALLGSRRRKARA